MEWVEVVSSLVSNVGFPIAACVGIFYLLFKQMQQTQTESEARAKRDLEFQRIISENTSAVQSLRQLVETLHKEE